HHCRRSHPRPARPLTRSTRDLLLNALAKFGARAVTLSCGLHCALHLHTAEHIGCAWRAAANMSVDGLHLARGEFSVKICIEFCGEFVGHRYTLSFFRRTSRSALRARDRRDITVPMGIESESAISWYDISSTSHSSNTSRKWSGSSSIAVCSRCSCDFSMKMLSGVPALDGISGASSASSGTEDATFKPVREVRNVLRRMRYIHARKFVPG